MVAAVISSQGVVTARIVAEAGVDQPPPDCILINISDDVFVDIGYHWNEIDGFYPDPTNPLSQAHS